MGLALFSFCKEIIPLCACIDCIAQGRRFISFCTILSLKMADPRLLITELNFDDYELNEIQDAVASEKREGLGCNSR